MPDDSNDLVPSSRGFFDNIVNRLKLIGRLLSDDRISPLLKLLPIGSLLYLFVPDLAPGPVDDALIVWLGSTLFVELCPPAVVEEHMNQLQKVIPGEWKDPEGDVVIDGEVKDLD